MDNDEVILKPWYGNMDDYDYGEMNRRLKRFEPEKEGKWSKPSSYMEGDSSYVPPRQIIDRKPPHFPEYPNGVYMWTLAEMTVAARLALRGERPFAMRRDVYNASCLPWFEEQRKKGLQDVALISSFVMPDHPELLGPQHAAMFCWYGDGTVSRVIISYDVNVNRLMIEGTPLPDCKIVKPVCLDNAHEFHEALLDAASVAPNVFWMDYFASAANMLESDKCEYDKQSGMFYLPKPYYKYMLAVDHSNMGGGMGSWNDTPIVGTREFRIVNAELAYQKLRAMLYAVNNC